MSGQMTHSVRPSLFYFLFYRFFSQQVSVGGPNKNKNKIQIHKNKTGNKRSTRVGITLFVFSLRVSVTK